MSAEASPNARLSDLPGTEEAAQSNRRPTGSADDAANQLRPNERLIRIKEVLHRVGVHRGTIYKWIKDGRFPRQIPLGANSAAWYETEIDAWIADPMGWSPTP